MNNGVALLNTRGQEDLARAIAAERGLPYIVQSSPSAPRTVQFPPLGPDEISLGVAEVGGDVGLNVSKLIEGRLLIQGASGGGKSWTLRRVLEQTHGLIQQIVIDPEGEFRSLAEAKGHHVIDASRLDAAAVRTLANRVREHRLSILLDLSETDRESQMILVAAFLTGLIDAPREHWHAALVAIDEAHLFAPFGGHSSAGTAVRQASIGAVTDLMSRGRKRGLAGILATQRLARMAKSVISEAQNFLIGINTLDLDIRRAAETIGWDARKAFDRLPMLKPGDFVASGPSFVRGPIVLRVGDVETRHRGATPAVAAPIVVDAEAAAALLDIEGLVDASTADAEVREEAELATNVRAVRDFIRDDHSLLAMQAYHALKPLMPNGARIADMATHFQTTNAAVVGAIALLDRAGCVEISGEGGDRSVRLNKGMRSWA